ncbi:MAG: NAD(P)-dependent oxidoreductase [Pseudomonadota bacterium]
MKHVVVVEPIHPDGLALLEAERGLGVTALPAGATRAEMLAAVPGASAILVRVAPLDAALLAAAPALEIVSKHGVGCDNIDLAHCRARGIPVTVAADANAISVAEHTLTLMLAAAKRLAAQEAAARAAAWGARGGFGAIELSGRTLLVIGFGRVGRRVARLSAAFGMRVLAHDPLLDPEAETAGAERAPDLDRALGEADIVCLHTPLTSATRGLLDAARLARLRPGAILVNAARGGIVEEAALRAALIEGRLGAYASDVFATEPLAPDDPILTAPNTVLTPHAAAMTGEAMRAMALQSAANIRAHFAGLLDPGVLAP